MIRRQLTQLDRVKQRDDVRLGQDAVLLDRARVPAVSPRPSQSRTASPTVYLAELSAVLQLGAELLEFVLHICDGRPVNSLPAAFPRKGEAKRDIPPVTLFCSCQKIVPSPCVRAFPSLLSLHWSSGDLFRFVKQQGHEFRERLGGNSTGAANLDGPDPAAPYLVKYLRSAESQQDHYFRDRVQKRRGRRRAVAHVAPPPLMTPKRGVSVPAVPAVPSQVSPGTAFPLGRPEPSH